MFNDPKTVINLVTLAVSALVITIWLGRPYDWRRATRWIAAIATAPFAWLRRTFKAPTTKGQELRTTRMPPHADMYRRLLNVTDEPHEEQYLFPLLLKSAERELNGIGVVTMVQLALYDYAQNLPPFGRGFLQIRVKPLIEALVDDEEVKADALRFDDEVKTKAQEEQASQPVPKRPKLSDGKKRSLVRNAKRIARIFDEYVDDPSVSHGHRVGGANPFYDQTVNGLYLAFYYSSPSELWTPWGSWHFAAAQPYQLNLEGFMSRLTLREHTPERHTSWGVQGAVYAILAIDGEELPEPELLTDKRQYFSYEDAKAEWDRLFAEVD